MINETTPFLEPKITSHNLRAEDKSQSSSQESQVTILEPRITSYNPRAEDLIQLPDNNNHDLSKHYVGH